MQHYGLPTRLLDWSRSPLVGAYFAAEHYLPPYDGSLPEIDGAIWVLAPHALNRYGGSHIDHTPAINSQDCSKLVQGAFFGKASREDPSQAMAVMAYETDLRMFVQQGAFTIHETRDPLDEREDAGLFLRKIIVPAAHLEAFAKEIDLCGLRQGDIFPDLEHLAAELKHSKGKT